MPRLRWIGRFLLKLSRRFLRKLPEIIKLFLQRIKLLKILKKEDIKKIFQNLRNLRTQAEKIDFIAPCTARAIKPMTGPEIARFAVWIWSKKPAPHRGK